MKSLKIITLMSLITSAPFLRAMDQLSEVAFAKEEKWAENYITIKNQQDEKLEEELKPRKALVMQQLAAMNAQSLQALTDDQIVKMMASSDDERKRRKELLIMTHLIITDEATTRPMFNHINSSIIGYLLNHKITPTEDEIRYDNYERLANKRDKLQDEHDAAKRKRKYEEYLQKKEREENTKHIWEPLVDNVLPDMPENAYKNPEIPGKIAAIYQLTDAELLQRLAINGESDQKLYESQDHIDTVFKALVGRLFNYAQASVFTHNADFVVKKLSKLHGNLQLRMLQYKAATQNEIIEFASDCTLHAITPDAIMSMSDTMIYPLFGIPPAVDLEGLLKNKKTIKEKHDKLAKCLQESNFPNDPNQESALKRINDFHQMLTARMNDIGMVGHL